jgi:hypothetical protein
MSVGASPGMQFGAHLGLDFAQYDYVFFDSLVNDEHYAKYMGPEQYNERVLYEIISTLGAATRLIVLGFPRIEFLQEVSTRYRNRQATARLCGAQFVSARDLVLDCGRAILGEGIPLYEHQGHPDRRISFAIGHAIGRALAVDDGSLPFGHGRSFAAHFSTVAPSELAAGRPLVARQTGQIAAEFLPLGPGESVDFPQEATCLGFFLDSAVTQAVVRLEGSDGPVVKELLYPPKEKFLYKFVPIEGGRRLRRLTVLAPDSVPEGPAEASIYSIRMPYLAEQARLFLGPALFWTGDPAAPLSPQAGEFPAELLQQRVRALLAESLAQAPPTRPEPEA